MVRLEKEISSGLSPQRSGFATGSVHMGFVVKRAVLGKVFLRVLLFPPLNITPPCLSIPIYHLGMDNRPVYGRSSKT